MVLADVLPYLRCPMCGGALTATTRRTVGCPRGHSFDVARQGYLHLGTGRPTHRGDSAEMVAARQAWLATGGYDFVSDALVAAAGPTRGLVVDVGAGTGHHLAAVLDASPDAVGVAVDVSKPALRRAARAHRRLGAVFADAWRGLPLATASAAVVLDVFAPRHGAEFRRLLRPDGVLVVATPTAAHLAELTAVPGLPRVDPEKVDRLAASLTPWFRAESHTVHTRSLSVTREQARLLVGMGPGARHADPGRVAADLPEPLRVTAAVRVARYRPA